MGVENASREHIQGLDGIRALAFLLVYVSHMGLGHSFTGGTGVTVFFFLSGYLITTLMRVESRDTGTISIFEFYTRRFFRIFPPLYVTVLFASVLFSLHLIGGSFSWKGISYILLYLANFRLAGPHYGWPDGLAVTWSLSIEEHFYLLFPWLYLSIFHLSQKKQAVVIATLCGLGLLWRSILAYGLHATILRIYLYTDTRFDSILLGCLLAVLANPLFDSVPGWFTRSPRLYAALGVMGVLFFEHIPYLNLAISYSLVGISLFPVFWFAILYSEDRYCRWLNASWLKTIGKWSYALYLGHQVIISLVERAGHFHETTAALVAMAPVLGYGFLMSKFVEKPCNRMRNRFLQWHRKTNTQPIAKPAFGPTV
jgi:peptidoglycan/LPS O-acetylase OafA/YrhL